MNTTRCSHVEGPTHVSPNTVIINDLAGLGYVKPTEADYSIQGLQLKEIVTKHSTKDIRCEKFGEPKNSTSPNAYDRPFDAPYLYLRIKYDPRYRNNHNRLVLFTVLIHCIRMLGSDTELVHGRTYTDVLYEGMLPEHIVEVNNIINDRKIKGRELLNALSSIRGL